MFEGTIQEEQVEEDAPFTGYRKLALLLGNLEADQSEEANVAHLRELLSSVHYDTKKCSYCGWVDNPDSFGTHLCLECEQKLQVCDDCDEAYIEALDGYCCVECTKSKAIIEEETEKGKSKRPAEEDLDPEAPAKRAKCKVPNDCEEKAANVTV